LTKGGDSLLVIIFIQLKDISVIIVNYKGGEKLARCLSSLQAIHDRRFSFEVIVVDNHSNDGTLENFIHQYPDFRFVSNSGNNGFANGCNLGASKSTGKNLLFLNPDTSVNADALFDMLEEVRVRPEFSIVSCSQVRENGSKERPYGKFLTLFTLTGWLRSIHRILFGRMEDTLQHSKHYIYPDWVSGSVVMMQRESFFRLGKWDEDFWMYFEDVDLCWRAKERNGEIVKLRSAVIGHLHGGSSRLNLETTVLTKTEVHISRHLYIAKHENSWKAIPMHLILILNNMLFGIVPALVGLLLFPVKRLRVCLLVYLRLADYYLNALKSGTWMSVRSVNFGRKDSGTLSGAVASAYTRQYNRN